MKYKLFIAVIFISTLVKPVKFQGLTETGIDKNSFLCPAADQEADCVNTDTEYIGASLSDTQPIQIFNNQSFWLKKEAQREQFLNTDKRYSGTSLSDKMRSEGWLAMGGYCILISTSPTLTNIVMPNIKATAGKVKVVVQLWYNGDNLIQLWSQDAAILPEGKGFKVNITSSIDLQVGQLPPIAKETTLIGQIGLQQNNRQLIYVQAEGSPRTVKIQVV